MSSEIESSDLLSFNLPRKYLPGTDLMSKWILNDIQITNIIISKVIGEHAQDQYTTKPTEWPNFTKSDVLYCPINKTKDKTLPPVLIEVQHTANMKFFRRLINYSLSVREQYPTSPIVIAICIHNTSSELMDMATECTSRPFMKQLPCQGWAQSCYLINKQTISNHLQQAPLDPLVAIAHFFIEQQPSLIRIKQHDDKTIRVLYSIAKRIFEGEFTVDEDKDAVLKEVCDQTYIQLNTTKQTLIEDVADENLRKRTIDCLDFGLKYIDEIRKIHKVDTSSSTSQPGTKAVIRPQKQKSNRDWQFVDEYREEKGKGMDWNQCFELAKQKGLFKNYSKMDSAKAAYFRSKK